MKKNALVVREAASAYAHLGVTTGQLLTELVGEKAAQLCLEAGGLQELTRFSEAELCIRLGKSAGRKLSAALELGRRSLQPRERGATVRDAAEVYRIMRPRMAHLTCEEFHVMLMDARHRAIRTVRIAQGGVTACALTARDVFEPAIREAAPAIVAIHNHPSGDPSPSQDDVALTRRLEEAADILGIRLLDHVVVAEAGFTSLRASGRFA